MNDFNYYAPTKVVFGKGAEQKVGNLIKEQNCKKGSHPLWKRQCQTLRSVRQDRGDL